MTKVDIQVPTIGESITEGTVSTILKSVGSIVQADEEIFELETDKVNQAVYSPASGKLSLSVKEGDTVQVGQVVGFIDTESKDVSPPTIPKKPTPLRQEKKPLQNTQGARISIEESLSEKRPPSQDVSSEQKNAPPASPKKEGGKESRKKMSKLRRVISERLVSVKNETAMLTTFNELDMTAVMNVRSKEQDSFQKKHGVKLGFMSFFVKACVAALQEIPEINARIEGDEIVYQHDYDIGIAVGTDKGLMVPILRNADRLSSAEIEKQLKEYAEKARANAISIQDLQGGTFTITNGGVYGSMLSTPILNPPQSAILGMHNIVKRAVVVDDQIVIRPIMYLALSYDHRIVDGKDSIAFLMHIKKNLEEPTRLLLDL